MRTNPVQQRMEYLADLWNDLPRKNYKVIRTLVSDQDEAMLDAFYWYMLGIDAPLNDIAILLESDFIDIDVFSDALVKEVENVVNLWNEADFSDTDIKQEIIKWRPDYTIRSKNRAALFADNMNSLVESLALHPQRLVVANLYMPAGDSGVEKDMAKWLTELVKLDLHPQFKVIITDRKENLLFEKTANWYTKEIYTWNPDIDSGNVVSKIAAMGDPSHSETGYRLAFMKMMKAISEDKYSQTYKEWKHCFSIAEKHIEKDPQWLSQLVMLHIILSNEQVKRGKSEEAFEEADRAILKGSLLPDTLGKQMGSAVLAQALINKAVVLCRYKKWKEANPLFQSAAENMSISQMWLPAMDAYRMGGICAIKEGRRDWALECLIKGFRTCRHVEDKALRASTFHLLLLLLLKEDHKDEVSIEEINEKATSVYGENWREYINKYKNTPDLENLYDENPFLQMEEERK